jgi:hypothetical protein
MSRIDGGARLQRQASVPLTGVRRRPPASGTLHYRPNRDQRVAARMTGAEVTVEKG